MSGQPDHPGLGDLIDLEYQLESMPDADSDHHLEAARAVGQGNLADNSHTVSEWRQKIADDRGLRWKLCASWLRRLRTVAPNDVPMPGLQVEAGLRFGGTLLSFIGFLAGAGAASASLGYSGNAPINLWQFLAVFVVLQLVLLIVTGLAVGTSWLRKTTWLSMSQRWLLHAANRRIPPQLLTRGRLYQESQRWLLIQLTQRFGVFFNLGVLAIFGWLVIFSELTFAWSTTPANFKPGMLASVVSILALPWSWILPSAPGAEAVEQTRWSRLDSNFLAEDQQAAAAYAADWWAFLYIAVLFWGLLPRLVAWWYARRKFRLSLQRVPFNHAAFLDLYEQMLPTAIGNWESPAPDQVQGKLLPRPGEPGAGSRSFQGNSTSSGEVDVVLWGGWNLPEQPLLKVADHFGRGCRRQRECGGANQREDEEALKKLTGSTDGGVVVLVEAEESPDKRLLHFLKRLRGGMPSQSPIHVTLVNWHDGQLQEVEERRLHLWRTFLAALTDPYLRIVSQP